MAKDAYLAQDVIVFNKKNLFLYEGTSVPEGALILNPRSKFIMKRGSSSSYNLCVCPGNHMPMVGMWKLRPLFSMEEIIQHEEKIYAPEDRIAKDKLNTIFTTYYSGKR